jgi:hypothetical protein
MRAINTHTHNHPQSTASLRMVSLHIVKHPRSRTGGKVQITKTDLLPSPFHVDQDDDDASSSSSSSQQLRGPLRRVCLVCKAKASAYSCPRCATPYCSAACYKVKMCVYVCEYVCVVIIAPALHIHAPTHTHTHTLHIYRATTKTAPKDSTASMSRRR